jgi:hypothetical protein
MAIWYCFLKSSTSTVKFIWLKLHLRTPVPKENLHTKQTLAESKKLFRAEEEAEILIKICCILLSGIRFNKHSGYSFLKNQIATETVLGETAVQKTSTKQIQKLLSS